MRAGQEVVILLLCSRLFKPCHAVDVFAEPWRVICRFSDFLDEIWTLYDNEDTAGHAVSTGWLEVDRYYRVTLPSAWPHNITPCAAAINLTSSMPLCGSLLLG